ncbi:MAG: hypothetical protein DHS20C02_14450 [Micavibrio sp.]|nr:MAG: hypothetical protein DHS20C02_14450 [Micavibrio sp.]
MSIPGERDNFLYTKDGFGKSAFSADTFSGNTQKKTMLACLAPNLNVKVKASNVKQHQVDATKGNARSNIQPNKAALASISQQCAAAKADISSTIRQAQGEVVAAGKAIGCNPAEVAEVYPKTQTAPGSGAELALGAVAVPKAGPAAALSGLAKKTSAVEDVIGNSKSYSSKKQKEAAIEDQLRQASSPTQQDTRAGFDVAMTADGAPDQLKQTKCDWNAFLDNNCELKDLMEMNPDAPPPGLCPEWAELDQIECAVQAASETLVYADEATKHEDGPQSIASDDIIVTCSSLQGFVGGCPKGTHDADLCPDIKNAMAALKKDPENAAKTVLATYNEEPDPRLLQPMPA